MKTENTQTYNISDLNHLAEIANQVFDEEVRIRVAFELKNGFAKLYEHIAHGDEEHRAWLKKAINEFYETNYNKKV